MFNLKKKVSEIDVTEEETPVNYLTINDDTEADDCLQILQKLTNNFKIQSEGKTFH